MDTGIATSSKIVEGSFCWSDAMTESRGAGPTPSRRVWLRFISDGVEHSSPDRFSDADNFDSSGGEMCSDSDHVVPTVPKCSRRTLCKQPDFLHDSSLLLPQSPLPPITLPFPLLPSRHNCHDHYYYPPLYYMATPNNPWG